MSHIHINGYKTFNAWREQGYPGAVSFNPDGSRKGATPAPLRRRTPACAAANCERVASVTGLCWQHYERQRVLRRGLTA